MYGIYLRYTFLSSVFLLGKKTHRTELIVRKVTVNVYKQPVQSRSMHSTACKSSIRRLLIFYITHTTINASGKVNSS